MTFFPGFSLDVVDGFKSSRLTIVIYGDYTERGLCPKAVTVYVELDYFPFCKWGRTDSCRLDLLFCLF